MKLETCKAAATLARTRARNARRRQDLARAAEYDRLAEALEWLLARSGPGGAGPLGSWQQECALIEHFTGTRPRSREQAERLKAEAAR